MKIRLAFLFLNCIMIIPGAFPQKADLDITVVHVMAGQGAVKVGVFDNEKDFEKKESPVFEAVLAADDTAVQHMFRGIGSGQYAIAVFHDENGDDTLNTRILGIPEEGVGFSGEKLKGIRPPDFKEAGFFLQRDTTIVIPLRYPTK